MIEEVKQDTSKRQASRQNLSARHGASDQTQGWRLLARKAILSLACCFVVRAQTTNEDDLELLTKDLGVSLWDESFTVRSGAGYDDNVLLDDTRVRGCFLLSTTALTAAMVFRLPIDNWDIDFFVTGDDYRRYTRDIGVGSQDLLDWLLSKWVNLLPMSGSPD